MESFDTLMLLVVVTAVFIMLKKTPPAWNRWLLIISIVAALVHVSFEGPRWQMVPAYFAIVFLTGVIWIQKYWIRAASAIVALMIFGTSMAFSWAFPIFELPQPDGTFAVGTTEAILVDDTRAEACTDDLDDVRRLMLRIWYPAAFVC